MEFSTGLPGVMHYPPSSPAWERSMTAPDFQLVARTADDLGFDALSIPEHLLVPHAMTDAMGSHWPHAMTGMAFVAGATSRLVVDSSVLVLPWHEPIQLAKAVSTLDVLSGGRLRLTIGVGAIEREFDLLGVSFAERGRIADEYLAAMIELWTADEPAFHGRYVAFDGAVFEPRPVQKPHPPIRVGGNSPAAMRRAARHDGWYPNGLTPQQLVEGLDYISAQPGFAERTRPFEVVHAANALVLDHAHNVLPGSRTKGDRPGAQELVDAVGTLRDCGVTATSVPITWPTSLTEHIEALHWIAEEIIAPFR
jgi:probable F420-dependent oxidoreductase